MAALRSLLIELGLVDGVSKQLQGIDSQIDGIESKLTGTQTEFDDLSRETVEFGQTARSEIREVGSEVSKLDSQVEGHAKTAEKTAESVEKSWLKIGAAIGAAAVAGEMFARSQQDNYVTAAKISQITGLEREEIIKLSTELTNVSNSLDDAYGVMLVGAQQGLKSQKELEAFVKVWDDISTASGESAVELARASVSLRAVGIDATNLTESYDTLGFVLTHTTSSISDFLQLTGYMARDMDQYGMQISDVAVLLAALEEKGMGAADARRALRSAMTSAKGDLTALYKELGITTEQIGRLNKEISGGTEFIEEINNAYNETRTPLQRVQIEFSKIANTVGAELNPLIGFGSMLFSGLSTALITSASAAHLYSIITTTSMLPALSAAISAAWAFTAALLANPITWIILGIVALGAALFMLAKNWDKVSNWFTGTWEKVSSAVSGAINAIKTAWDNTVDKLVSGAKWLVDHMKILTFLFPVTAPIAAMKFFSNNWDKVVEKINSGWNKLTSAAKEGVSKFGEKISSGLSGIKDTFSKYHPLGIIVRQWNEITDFLKRINLKEIGKNILSSLLSGILNIKDKIVEAVKGIGKSILDTIKGFFGISSPSKLMQNLGEQVGEGFVIGVTESLPENLQVSGVITEPTITSPTLPQLSSEIVYYSTVKEPDITRPEPIETRYEQISNTEYTQKIVQLVEPKIEYDPVYLEKPEITTLTGTIEYLSSVVEPIIEPLKGIVEYLGIITKIPENIPAFNSTINYESDLIETPEITTLTGTIEYLSSVIEPVIEPLRGIVEYLGIITSTPELPNLEASYNVNYIGTEEPVIFEKQPNIQYSPENDYSQREIREQIRAETGDVIFNTTINVTTQSSDGNEIATIIDRRLRQTFDRNAEAYFARQNRRRSIS